MSHPTRKGVFGAYANRPQGYKKNFMLNSGEHEICPANKSQITNNNLQILSCLT